MEGVPAAAGVRAPSRPAVRLLAVLAVVVGGWVCGCGGDRRAVAVVAMHDQSDGVCCRAARRTLFGGGVTGTCTTWTPTEHFLRSAAARPADRLLRGACLHTVPPAAGAEAVRLLRSDPQLRGCRVVVGLRSDVNVCRRLRGHVAWTPRPGAAASPAGRFTAWTQGPFAVLVHGDLQETAGFVGLCDCVAVYRGEARMAEGMPVAVRGERAEVEPTPVTAFCWYGLKGAGMDHLERCPSALRMADYGVEGLAAGSPESGEEWHVAVTARSGEDALNALPPGGVGVLYVVEETTVLAGGELAPFFESLGAAAGGEEPLPQASVEHWAWGAEQVPQVSLAEALPYFVRTETQVLPWAADAPAP